MAKLWPGNSKTFRRVSGGWTSTRRPDPGFHWSAKTCDACKDARGTSCGTCGGTRRVFFQRKN